MKNCKRSGSSPKFLDKDKRKAIEQALHRLAREGLIVDSGERRWSEHTGRYEIVWKSKIYKGAS
jgi:hypothetical protein